MRECNYGTCDPLDHGELEKSLRGKIHNLIGISGYRHVPPCPLATRCPECDGRGVTPRLLPSGADIPTCKACKGTGVQA